MYNFIIVSLFLIFSFQRSPALIPRSESYIFSKEYERETVNDVLQSISDIKHNIQNLNFYGTFYEQTDEENNKNNKNEIRKGLDENQDIRRILNEIKQEEANDTKLTDDVEEVVRGFLSDLEYYKDKINESFVDFNISDHVVLNDLAEEENDTNFDNNTLIEESEDDAEEVNEPGGETEDVKEYNPSPDESPTSGRRIYRGKNTRISQFPFLASIHVMGKFYCAGSIIGSSLVITAASCLQLAWNNRFFRENPKFLYVRVGSTFYNGAGEFIQVLEVYFHPGYDPRSLRNNLAIVRLRRKIKMSKKNKKHVKKIRYDTLAHPLPVNTDSIIILGWGAKEIGNKITNPMTNRLSYAVLDVYGLKDCQDVYSKEFVTKRHFCAGFISKGGGACNRDVGAPGLVGGILAGVVSFGAPVCGAHDAPTVFTKLGYYRDWIKKIEDQPFHDVKRSTDRFIPYLKHELIATPTTRMMSRTPYIDPEVKDALEGVSFLPPTSTYNPQNDDAAVNNMLLLAMGRPAIADQPYYQVEHLDKSKVDPMEEMFGFKQVLREKSTVKPNLNFQQMDRNNDLVINNYNANAIGKIKNPVKIIGRDYQYSMVKPKNSINEMSKSDNRLLDMSRLYMYQKQRFESENQKLESEKQNQKLSSEKNSSFHENEDQLETNNQYFIANNDKSQKKKQITNDADPITVPESKYVASLPRRLPKIKPSDIDTVEKRPNRFPANLEPERIIEKQPISAHSSQQIRSKLPSSKSPANTFHQSKPASKKQLPQRLVENVKEKLSSNDDPDRSALDMLDKVVNDLKPNQDYEGSQDNDNNDNKVNNYDEDPLPEQPAKAKSVKSGTAQEEVEYVNIENVPMIQEEGDANGQPVGGESVIEEKYINWDDVVDSSETTTHWSPLNANERNEDDSNNDYKPYNKHQSKKIKKPRSSDDRVPKSNQNFREIDSREIHFKSRPAYPLLANRDINSVPAPSDVQQSEKSEKILRYPKTIQPDITYKKYETTTELHNIDKIKTEYNRANNIPDHPDYMHLSMAEESSPEDKYALYDDKSGASEISSFSAEGGLEIEPANEKKDLNIAEKETIVNLNVKSNNTESLKDEFYHIFADVVNEIANGKTSVNPL